MRIKEEVLKAWQKQFTNLLKPAGTKLRANYANDSGTYDEALSRPISMEEVQCAIAQLQEDKVPGPDNMCPSVVKNDMMYQDLHDEEFLGVNRNAPIAAMLADMC